MSKQKSDPVPVHTDCNRAALSPAYKEIIDREMRRCEKAWLGGSVPALVDAIICCHETQEPIPLWVAQGSITLIKMLFTGKSLAKRGRTGNPATRSRTDLIDYARWEAVKEFENRRAELPEFINHLPYAMREKRPEMVALNQDNTLDQRCAAVSELFDLNNDPAKGRPDTILRSYKKVQREMKKNRVAPYYLPGFKNPLYSIIA